MKQTPIVKMQGKMKEQHQHDSESEEGKDSKAEDEEEAETNRILEEMRQQAKQRAEMFARQ